MKLPSPNLDSDPSKKLGNLTENANPTPKQNVKKSFFKHHHAETLEKSEFSRGFKSEYLKLEIGTLIFNPAH